MAELSELIALFLSAFIAATILPAQSEMVLAGLHLTGTHNTLLLVLIATLGNVLGACVNWLLGRYLVGYQDRKWFPFKEAAINKAKNFYQKWGVWTLLLAWVPIIGDPLTLVAGFFRTNFWLFLVLVTIGKSLRYAAIIAVL